MNLKVLWGVAIALIILGAAAALAGKATPSLNATPTPVEESIVKVLALGEKQNITTEAAQELSKQPAAFAKVSLAGISSIDILAGTEKKINLTFASTGAVSGSFKIYTTSGPVWMTFSTDAFHISAEGSKIVTLILKPPANVAGEFLSRLYVQSVSNPEEIITHDLKINVITPTKGAGITGYTVLVTGGIGGAIIGAIILSALLLVSMKAMKSTRAKIDYKEPKPFEPKPFAAEGIVGEVLKQQASETYDKETVTTIYGKLVPYEKVPGKWLWEV